MFEELPAVARIVRALDRDLGGTLGLRSSSWCVERLSSTARGAYRVTGQVTGVVLDEDLIDDDAEPYPPAA